MFRACYHGVQLQRGEIVLKMKCLDNLMHTTMLMTWRYSTGKRMRTTKLMTWRCSTGKLIRTAMLMTWRCSTGKLIRTTMLYQQLTKLTRISLEADVLRSLDFSAVVTVCPCMRFPCVIRSGYLVLANQHTSSEGQGSRDLRQTRVEPY